jgi:hypothetical protein
MTFGFAADCPRQETRCCYSNIYVSMKTQSRDSYFLKSQFSATDIIIWLSIPVSCKTSGPYICKKKNWEAHFFFCRQTLNWLRKAVSTKKIHFFFFKFFFQIFFFKFFFCENAERRVAISVLPSFGDNSLWLCDKVPKSLYFNFLKNILNSPFHAGTVVTLLLSLFLCFFLFFRDHFKVIEKVKKWLFANIIAWLCTAKVVNNPKSLRMVSFVIAHFKIGK